MRFLSRRPALPGYRRPAAARSIERGLGITALLATLMLLAGVLVVRTVADEASEAGKDASRASQIELELETLSASMAGAEAGVRAYLMSARSSALEPYQVAHVEASLSLQALRPLSSAQTFQSNDVEQLEALVQSHFDTLAKVVSRREDVGLESARQLLDSDATRLTSSHIDALLKNMSAREESLRKDSLARQARHGELAQSILVATLLLLALIAFAFWGTLKREFMLRRRLELRLSETVTEDELTGAINRSAFERLLEQEWAFRQRYATPLSAILIEVDNLGAVNAKYGLDVGDHLLRDISNRLRARLRTTERLARYSGHQFALLVPQSLNDARELATQLAELIVTAPYPVLGPDGLSQAFIEVQLSLGIADASDVNQPGQLVLGAGEALYAAKRLTGALRIEIYRVGMRQAGAHESPPKSTAARAARDKASST